jgi:hypothetical protein
MNGSLRRVARNVKRWKDEKMIRRWVALGIAEAQKGFGRVKGYVTMPSLVAAIRPTAAPGGAREERRVRTRTSRRDYAKFSGPRDVPRIRGAEDPVLTA